jgi:hypothetical protein
MQFQDWMIDWWNWVELVSALGSASCLFPSLKETQRRLVGNLFAIVRIFRIIRYIPTLKTLVNTIMVSLPSLIYVMELLGMSIYEFSIIFWNSFENMAPGNGIGNDINFQTFLYSFVTIFQVNYIWKIYDIEYCFPLCFFFKNKFYNCKFEWFRAYLISRRSLFAHIYIYIYKIT